MVLKDTLLNYITIDHIREKKTRIITLGSSSLKHKKFAPTAEGLMFTFEPLNGTYLAVLHLSTTTN